MASEQVETSTAQGYHAGSSSSSLDRRDPDDGLLASLGYRQEFRREFTRWSTLSYAISILGVLGSGELATTHYLVHYLGEQRFRKTATK